MLPTLAQLVIRAALIAPLLALTSGAPRPGHALFDREVVHELHLELADDAVDSLRRDPRAWVSGAFGFGGQRWDGVGVRIKGHRSLRAWDEKPAFKLHFGKFAKGQRVLGMKQLALNNMVEDPTMLREHLAYRLYRAAGVAAPRTAYARVYINGDYVGLYLAVEIASRAMLRDHYDDAEGPLYEGEYGCDLYPGDVEGFDQDVGGGDRDELAALADAAARGTDALFGRLDRRRVLAYLAVSAALGDFDGYRHGHNYQLYYEPARGSWSLLPWGLDRTFKKRLDPYDSGGLIAVRCFADEACRADYARELRRVAELMEQLEIDRAMWRTAQVIDEAAMTDPRRPHSLKDVADSRRAMRAFAAERPAELRAATTCLELGDSDGDGYACRDCAGDDPAIHPGAAEVCDGVDNDCDGLIDDAPGCGCETVTAAGTEVALCALPMTWAEASAFCAARGQELARFDDRATADAVAEAAHQRAADKWWIGANDHGDEGSFTWTDGGALTFARWAKGEPDNDACNQDCAAIGKSGSRWHDTHCASRLPFVCR